MMDFKTVIELVKSRWYQFVVACVVSMSHMFSSMAMGWTSPLLHGLRGADLPLHEAVSARQEGWLGAIALLGGMCGPLIVVPLWRSFGRRTIFIASNVPLLLGWFVAGLATSLPSTYVTRFLWGCAAGMHYAIVPIYIGEIAQKEIRGTLGVLFAVFASVGNLVTCCLAPTSTYWKITTTGGVMTFLYVPLTWFIPETPFYLIYKGYYEEATVTLQKLRRLPAEEIRPELEALQETVARNLIEVPKIKDLWATKEHAKALGICVFLTMLQQMSGMSVVLVYLEQHLAKTDHGLSPAHGIIVLGIVQVIASFITPFVVDRISRKLIMWTTLLGLSICLGTVGIYELLATYYKYDVTSAQFLPLVCLIIFLVLNMLGLASVPWVLVSEMFPPNTRSVASGICSFMTQFAGFIWISYFNYAIASFGTYTGFWVLAGCCAVGCAAVTFLLDTRGKSLDDIQEMINKRNKEKPVVEKASKKDDSTRFAF